MKMISKFGMSIAAIAGAVIMGSTPMTAFAQTGPESECICEDKCGDKVINEDCPICVKDFTLCQGKEPEIEEETASENEVVEEPMGPLTPDGNLDLVDDYGSTQAGGKQFITVVTKSGNYFYIIIDRDDNGTETVHFLNMVDESDLLKLMDDDEAKEYLESITKEEEVTPTETENPEFEEPVEEEPEKKKKANPSAYLGIMFIVGIGIAGGYVFMKKSKSKSTKKTVSDPDADYDEDEDYLAEMGIENESDEEPEDVSDVDEEDLSDIVDEDDLSEEPDEEE